jgi:hypothetical protein
VEIKYIIPYLLLWAKYIRNMNKTNISCNNIDCLTLIYYFFPLLQSWFEMEKTLNFLECSGVFKSLKKTINQSSAHLKDNKTMFISTFTGFTVFSLFCFGFRFRFQKKYRSVSFRFLKNNVLFRFVPFRFCRIIFCLYKSRLKYTKKKWRFYFLFILVSTTTKSIQFMKKTSVFVLICCFAFISKAETTKMDYRT